MSTFTPQYKQSFTSPQISSRFWMWLVLSSRAGWGSCATLKVNGRVSCSPFFDGFARAIELKSPQWIVRFMQIRWHANLVREYFEPRHRILCSKTSLVQSCLYSLPLLSAVLSWLLQYNFDSGNFVFFAKKTLPNNIFYFIISSGERLSSCLRRNCNRPELWRRFWTRSRNSWRKLRSIVSSNFNLVMMIM